MKKASLIVALTFSVLIALTGCKEQGDEFIGTWSRVDKEHQTDPTKDDILTITRDEGIFHIDRKYWGMLRNYRTEKFQARAESDSVISIINNSPLLGSGTFSMENGKLFTPNGAEYKRM